MKKDKYIPKHVLPNYKRTRRMAKRIWGALFKNFAAFPLELARTTYNRRTVDKYNKALELGIISGTQILMESTVLASESLDEWAEHLRANEEWMLTADGFDEAFIGVTEFRPVHLPRAVYSYEKCVDILMQRDGMERGEALEYMEFNVTGAYVGEQTPIFVRNLPY